MRRIIPAGQFNIPTLAAARFLLGKFLVRRTNGHTVARMITEVEAYDGPRDRASHASRGETPRNAPMFGPAGRWYLYFVYGMHWMLNLTTGPVGYPAAVLVRGVTGAAGPARVTRALRISNGAARRLNGKPATPKAGLWIENREVFVKNRSIRRSPRIGVSYAGPAWADKPYRFTLHTPG